MNRKIKVAYFPRALKFATPLMFAGAILLLIKDHYVWSFVVLLSGVIILTTSYVTEIDIQNRRYRDYVFFLGLFLNHEESNFKTLDRIVISKGNHSHMANTRSRSRQVDWTDYTATLLFDDSGSLDLLTRTDKQELITDLKDYAESFNVKIEDRTTKNHHWVG